MLNFIMACCIIVMILVGIVLLLAVMELVMLVAERITDFIHWKKH